MCGALMLDVDRDLELSLAADVELLARRATPLGGGDWAAQLDNGHRHVSSSMRNLPSIGGPLRPAAGGSGR